MSSVARFSCEALAWSGVALITYGVSLWDFGAAAVVLGAFVVLASVGLYIHGSKGR